MAEHTFKPARCVAQGASFRLITTTTYVHQNERFEGEMAVEPDELLDWIVTAAQFDGNFHQRVADWMARIKHEPLKG